MKRRPKSGSRRYDGDRDSFAAHDLDG